MSSTIEIPLYSFRPLGRILSRMVFRPVCYILPGCQVNILKNLTTYVTQTNNCARFFVYLIAQILLISNLSCASNSSLFRLSLFFQLVPSDRLNPHFFTIKSNKYGFSNIPEQLNIYCEKHPKTWRYMGSFMLTLQKIIGILILSNIMLHTGDF